MILFIRYSSLLNYHIIQIIVSEEKMARHSCDRACNDSTDSGRCCSFARRATKGRKVSVILVIPKYQIRSDP